MAIHTSHFSLRQTNFPVIVLTNNDEGIRLPKLSLPNESAFAGVSAVPLTEYIHCKVSASFLYRAGTDASDAPVY